MVEDAEQASEKELIVFFETFVREFQRTLKRLRVEEFLHPNWNASRIIGSARFSSGKPVCQLLNGLLKGLWSLQFCARQCDGIGIRIERQCMPAKQ